MPLKVFPLQPIPLGVTLGGEEGGAGEEAIIRLPMFPIDPRIIIPVIDPLMKHTPGIDPLGTCIPGIDPPEALMIIMGDGIMIIRITIIPQCILKTGFHR